MKETSTFGARRASRRHGRRSAVGALAAVAAVALVPAACGPAPRARTAEFGAASAPAANDAAQATGPRTAKSEAGQVTVAVTWAGPTPAATQTEFNVVLDTHAIDLDGFDLRELAVLRTDTGIEVRPMAWRAPKGGHHREGPLVFPSTDGGRAIPGADARSVEIIIRDVAGVPERRFAWPL
jgi:hypothetical protein